MDLQEYFAGVVGKFRDDLASAHSEQELRRAQAVALAVLGEKRKEWKGAGAPDEKRQLGLAFNEAKGLVERAIAERLAGLATEARAADLRRTVDVTLPGRAVAHGGLGHLHPITLARREIEQIFAQLGFVVATGPEVESDFYNFEALAMPKDHPARDMQDTFYIADAPDLVLRTHTSPVQVRTMLAERPPVRVIVPGVVYRKDDDPTHSPMFHQVEGLLVDEQVTLADLKGVLLHFARAFFGERMDVRLRPSFFPFTEPSAEVDISCVFCAGQGEVGGERCPLCKRTGWMEVGGAGMVDPEVFRYVGYDPEKYSGFAFGFGIDRMAMLKYNINDIKLYYEGDVRFLRQFPPL
jgi:phenylalanyl-tRNA synthetase alpha chain